MASIEVFVASVVARCRCDGYIRALRDYAVWRDGVQYVGCGVTPLAEAIRIARAGPIEIGDADGPFGERQQVSPKEAV